MNNSYKDFLLAHKTYLASGCCRRVFDLGNGYVLKEAKSEVGARNIRTEKTIFHSCPERLKKHLALIVMSGDSWLIMKKFSNEVPKTDYFINKLKQLHGEFEAAGYHANDLYLYGKPNWDNLRLDDSQQIIIIDYGDFEFKT